MATEMTIYHHLAPDHTAALTGIGVQFRKPRAEIRPDFVTGQKRTDKVTWGTEGEISGMHIPLHRLLALPCRAAMPPLPIRGFEGWRPLVCQYSGAKEERSGEKLKKL